MRLPFLLLCSCLKLNNFSSLIINLLVSTIKVSTLEHLFLLKKSKWLIDAPGERNWKVIITDMLRKGKHGGLGVRNRLYDLKQAWLTNAAHYLAPFDNGIQLMIISRRNAVRKHLLMGMKIAILFLSSIGLYTSWWCKVMCKRWLFWFGGLCKLQIEVRKKSYLWKFWAFLCWNHIYIYIKKPLITWISKIIPYRQTVGAYIFEDTDNGVYFRPIWWGTYKQVHVSFSSIRSLNLSYLILEFPIMVMLILLYDLPWRKSQC